MKKKGGYVGWLIAHGVFLLVTAMSCSDAHHQATYGNVGQGAVKIPARGEAFVKFYAPWCSPCTRLTPVVDSIKPLYPNIKFIEVNIDQNQLLSRQFNVSSIPYMVIIQNGRVKDTLLGFHESGEVKSFIEKNTAGNKLRRVAVGLH